jgi:hypothetical protein
MYNFVFWVLYMANLKDGRGYGRYNGTIVVALAILIHILLVFTIVKRLFFHESYFTSFKEWFNNNKFAYLIILALFAFLIFRYYNYERIEKILKKRSSESHPTKAINILKVLLIIFVPIILGAIILTI